MNSNFAKKRFLDTTTDGLYKKMKRQNGNILNLLPLEIFEMIVGFAGSCDRTGRTALCLSSTCQEARVRMIGLCGVIYKRELARVRPGTGQILPQPTWKDDDVQSKKENRRKNKNLWAVSLHLLHSKGKWDGCLLYDLKDTLDTARCPLWFTEVTPQACPDLWLAKTNPWFTAVVWWNKRGFYCASLEWGQFVATCFAALGKEFLCLLLYLVENDVTSTYQSEAKSAVRLADCIYSCLSFVEDDFTKQELLSRYTDFMDREGDFWNDMYTVYRQTNEEFERELFQLPKEESERRRLANMLVETAL